MRVESVGYQGGEGLVAHEEVVVRLIGPGFFSSCVISSIPQAPGASAELTMLTVSLNCHTGGRRPSFLAVSLSVFLLWFFFRRFRKKEATESGHASQKRRDRWRAT